MLCVEGRIVNHVLAPNFKIYSLCTEHCSKQIIQSAVLMAATDNSWEGTGKEASIFAFYVYFILCIKFLMSVCRDCMFSVYGFGMNVRSFLVKLVFGAQID